MLNINAYLHFMGKTEEAMNFYKSILGGEFTIFGRFRDVPGGENMNLDDQKKDHAYLPYNKKWYRYHGDRFIGINGTASKLWK
jgi:PhnB protein